MTTMTQEECKMRQVFADMLKEQVFEREDVSLSLHIAQVCFMKTAFEVLVGCNIAEYHDDRLHDLATYVVDSLDEIIKEATK